jgi:hypothetical protein
MIVRHVWPIAAIMLMMAVPPMAPAPSAEAQASQAPGDWTPPRTAWGEPDLQGIWTNATLTPVERPNSQADKTVLTAEEAAAFETRSAAQREASDRFVLGNVGAYNQFWMDGGKIVTGDRRTSLIVDPADGKIPWTPAGRERLASDSARYGVGPFDSWEDADTGERCLTDGLPFVPLQGYNMNYHILQSPGWVAIINEMFHEYRMIPVDGRDHVPSEVDQLLGDARGRWEGDTALSLACDLARGATEPAPGRAVHAGQRRDNRLRVHHDRSRHVHPAVDRPGTDDDQPGVARCHVRTTVRIRLPRRELRPPEHHAGSARAGE